ncbi:uncharacterized protein TA06765 [Theileria annulata]|uniref:UEV domain-containing protein n=1 Tax=Theileria annulata TaxID=5874 RepID=Q4UHS4_THEAN|nr:uncharacterized protein TA06765 [Theileria annulata]CAI73365.1 hypothetical protein, conserved [Theileria annulata]|eukprot:XP_954042.1 hypothetical protein, conserved [Theileria annulata]
MDSNLKSALKKHFSNYEMLMCDINGLFGKYHNFSCSMSTSFDCHRLNISGTVPYTFSGFTLNAPLLIQVFSDYPFSCPSFFVPSRNTKIVKNHPNVDLRGNVTLKYLDEWNHTSKLVQAVDHLCYAFSKISPIITFSNSPETILKSQFTQSPPEVTNQPMPENLFAKHKLSDRDRNLVEHAHQNILTLLKKTREDVIKQYNFNMKKYELHRKILLNWVEALLELNIVNLKMDEVEGKLENEMNTDALEKAESLQDEVSDLVRNLTNSRQILSSLEHGDLEIEQVVKFKDPDSEK